MQKLNILIIYEQNETSSVSTNEQLVAFKKFSKNNILYLPGNKTSSVELNLFDAVIVHHTINLDNDSSLSPALSKSIALYRGLKIIYITDENSSTEKIRLSILNLGFNLILTSIPQSSIELIYPKELFNYIEFRSIIGCYIPEKPPEELLLPALQDRQITIGFRDRTFPYCLGPVSHSRYSIPEKFKNICQENDIKFDISFDLRLGTQEYYDFLQKVKVTIGPETETNVIDEHAILQNDNNTQTKNDTNFSYDTADVYKKCPEAEDRMQNTKITQYIVDAIVCKTGLILFEGTYSDLLKPHKHYLPLCRDFRNLDDILKNLDDVDLLQNMVDCVYSDILHNPKLSYKNEIQKIDEIIDKKIRKGKGIIFVQEIDTDFSISRYQDIIGLTTNIYSETVACQNNLQIRQGQTEAVDISCKNTLDPENVSIKELISILYYKIKTKVSRYIGMIFGKQIREAE